MSRLPSPFQEEVGERVIRPPSSRESPCGFLALSRPAGPIALQRPTRRPGYSRRWSGHRFSSSRDNVNNGQHMKFSSFENTNRYRGNMTDHHSTYMSPDNNFYSPTGNYSPRSSSNSPFGSPGFQSTPYTPQRGSYRGRQINRNSLGGNSGPRPPHNTPLKDIPIDKFISKNMVKDPWKGLDGWTEDQIDHSCG